MAVERAARQAPGSRPGGSTAPDAGAAPRGAVTPGRPQQQSSGAVQALVVGVVVGHHPAVAVTSHEIQE